MVKIERRLFLLIGVGDQSRQQVDQEIDLRAMTCVLDLADVLELVVDGFDQRSFAQQEFIDHRHQLVLHILFELGDQLQAALIKLLGKLSATVHDFLEQSCTVAESLR